MEKSDFLKNICRCYVIEHLDKEETEGICDDIMKAVRAPLSDYSELMKKLNDCILKSNKTFKLQQIDLENISLRWKLINKKKFNDLVHSNTTISSSGQIT